MSAGVYKTNNALLRDSGLYNCIATSGGLASSHVIELVVEGRVREGYICQYILLIAVL